MNHPNQEQTTKINNLIHQLGSLPEEERSLLTPELRQWALGRLDEERIAAQLKELREGGGLELDDLIKDLEEQVESRERPGT
jgi:hypothetical protein